MCKQFTYRRNENLWPDFKSRSIFSLDLIAYIVCQLDFYFLIQLLIAWELLIWNQGIEIEFFDNFF